MESVEAGSLPVKTIKSFYLVILNKNSEMKIW